MFDPSRREFILAAALGSGARTTRPARAQDTARNDKVRWAPPAQDPAATMIYDVSSLPTSIQGRSNNDGSLFESDSVAITIPADQDATIVMPQAPMPVGQMLVIYGGRHIRLVGGHMQARLAILDKPSGSIFIEGLLIDLGPMRGMALPQGSTTDVTDAINVDAAIGTENVEKPDVYIQNTRILGVRGTYHGPHGDAFQMYRNGARDIYMDRLSFESDYQGLFFAGGTWSRNRYLSRIYGTYPGYPDAYGGYPLWLPTGAENGGTTHLDQVYIDIRQRNGVPSLARRTLAQNGVWPARSDPDVANFDNPDGSVSWPPAARIIGRVHGGAPPDGDFVALSGAQAPGIGYHSPGYGGM